MVVCISVLSGRLRENYIWSFGSPHYHLGTPDLEVYLIQVGDYHLKISCELCGRLVYHSVSHPNTNRAHCCLTSVTYLQMTLAIRYTKKCLCFLILNFAPVSNFEFCATVVLLWYCWQLAVNIKIERKVILQKCNNGRGKTLLNTTRVLFVDQRIMNVLWHLPMKVIHISIMTYFIFVPFVVN